MRFQAVIAAGLVLPIAVATTQVLAQGSERFRLEKTDSGYVRMDTQTGDIWVCRERSDEIICKPAVDEQEREENSLRLLRQRVATLEARVRALEEQVAGTTSELPSEEEFEQTLGLMERFFRRFMDIVKGLEEEQGQQPERKAEPPNRT